jgi:peptidylprolyl isomerase
MSIAKNGDNVTVHYTGKLTTGVQFDSSNGRDPLGFTIGAGQMIKGFDAALPGMAIGDKKTVTIVAAEAYGETNPEAIIQFPKTNVPADMVLEPGMPLTLTDQNGHPVQVLVVEVQEDIIVLDANHELAGKDLVFDIELVSIN